MPVRTPTPIGGCAVRRFAAIEERNFVHMEFQPIPAVVPRINPGHWRWYDEEPSDEAEWELVPGI